MAYTEKMSEKVKAEFDQYVSFISQMNGVLQIYLFGSYAYGEPREFSDIDIMVVVKDGINTLKVMQNISRGLCDRNFPLDVLAITDSEFKILSMPDRVTLQRDIKDRGVLVYGH